MCAGGDLETETQSHRVDKGPQRSPTLLLETFWAHRLVLIGVYLLVGGGGFLEGARHQPNESLIKRFGTHRVTIFWCEPLNIPKCTFALGASFTGHCPVGSNDGTTGIHGDQK